MFPEYAVFEDEDEVEHITRDGLPTIWAWRRHYPFDATGARD